jgi:hypothetical protein
MKNILILLLALPLPIIAQESHFEGVIKFNIVYSSTNTEINVADYTSFFGDHYISYIKPGFYRQDYPNAQGIECVYYDYLSNLYYFKLVKVDTLYTIDCSIPLTDELTEYADSTETILGYKCKSIYQSNPQMNSLYFYAEDLYLDPAFYVNHKMGNYDQFTALTKSIYLKIISNMGDVMCITTADSIVEMKLSDEIFMLPDLPRKAK